MPESVSYAAFTPQSFLLYKTACIFFFIEGFCHQLSQLFYSAETVITSPFNHVYEIAAPCEVRGFLTDGENFSAVSSRKHPEFDLYCGIDFKTGIIFLKPSEILLVFSWE